MIHIYRSRSSTGARQLSVALGAGRLFNLARLRRGSPQDLIVAWGEEVSNRPEKVLNGGPLQSKFTDAEVLKEAGIATIEASRQRPQPLTPLPPPPDPVLAALEDALEAARGFLEAPFRRERIYRDIVGEVRGDLTLLMEALDQPAPVAAPVVPVEWLGRRDNHVGGSDLLHPPNQPDYYVKKLQLTSEYRIHSFMGQSIRAGIKIPREHVQQHPWIRSWDGGWMISYDGESVRQVHRNLAHAAVRALGLDFGAVDIGQDIGGRLVVLEVNRAPGLDGGTIGAYVNAIRRVATGGV